MECEIGCKNFTGKPFPATLFAFLQSILTLYPLFANSRAIWTLHLKVGVQDLHVLHLRVPLPSCPPCNFGAQDPICNRKKDANHLVSWLR